MTHSTTLRANAVAHLDIAGERVHLLAQRALYWPARSTLFIADPHFGKSATFRHFGIAAPDETESDLARLEQLLRECQAKQLIVLGDFFHARAGRSESMFQSFLEWRSRNPELRIILVRGNHDHSAGDPPGDWEVNCVNDGWRIGPFVCCHKPCEDATAHVFCGHIHPAFSLRERSGSGLRAPCFVAGRRRTIFPAFGSFTGLAAIQPEEGDRIFAMNGEFILPVWGTA